MALALALPLAAGCVQQASSSTESSTPVIRVETSPEVGGQSVAEDSPGEQVREENITDAPARPISTEKVLPPNLKATGPVAEIIKLADAGVDESVMLAFVNKSMSTFNLRSDEIIYLKDIGVPSSVMTAMIQRDETLREDPANAAAALTAQAAGTSTQVDPQTGTTYSAPPPSAPESDYATEPYVPSTPPPAVEETTFYDSLSPYGSWQEVDGYGRCWQPTVVAVNSGWRPYFDGGRWVNSDCGWYWLSDYSWGWAPFHYGRWFRHQRLGWCWTPDTVWGPSWVSWRYNNDYCGWAPLPPRAHFRPGIGFAYGQSDFGLGIDCFAFIPFGHFRDHHLRYHALPHDHVARIFSQTVVSTRISASHDRVINHGIPVERVAAATRTEVPRVTLHEVNATGGRGNRVERLEQNGSRLAVFRPPLTHSSGSQTGRNDRARADVRGSISPATAENRVLEPSREIQAPNAHVLFPRSPAATAQAREESSTSSIHRDANRPTQPRERSSSGAITQTTAHNSVIIIGRKEVPGPQALNQASPPHELRQSRHSSLVTPTVLAEMQALSRSPQPASRASEPSARFERPQQTYRAEAPNASAVFESRASARVITPQPAPTIPHYAAPNYEPPSRVSRAETPRFNSAPSFAPAQTHSAPAMESHAHSAPSAPPPSAPASHSHSSSDRNSR